MIHHRSAFIRGIRGSGATRRETGEGRAGWGLEFALAGLGKPDLLVQIAISSTLGPETTLNIDEGWERVNGDKASYYRVKA